MFGFIETIIIGALSSLTLAMTALAIVFRIKYDRTIAKMVQLIIDKEALAGEIDRLSFIVDNSTDLENGFIKFLSESRELAHSYIENVQNSIQELKDAMDSNDEAKISLAYQKITSFLPDPQSMDK